LERRPHRARSSRSPAPPTGAILPPGSHLAFEVGYGDQAYRNIAHIYADDGTTRRVIDLYPFGEGDTTIVAQLLPSGSYSVTAVTVEGATSSPITVNVSTVPGANRPPAISASKGANGTVTVTATDTDAAPLARIDLYSFTVVLGELWVDFVGSSTTSPYTLTWPAGAESIWIIARDTAGLAVASSFTW